MVKNPPATQKTCIQSLGWEDPLEKGQATHSSVLGEYSSILSLVAQMVKNPPAMWETWVQSLGQEDPLEKGMVTLSSILAWRIPWTEKPGGLQSMGLQRVGQTERLTLSLSEETIKYYPCPGFHKTKDYYDESQLHLLQFK